MEAPAGQPLVSPALALELLLTPPAPIPKSDPLLVGRRCLLAAQPPDDTRRVGTPRPPSSSPACEAAAAAARPAAAASADAAAPSTVGGSKSPSGAAAADPAASADPYQHGDGGGGGGSYQQLPSHAAADLSYDEFVRRYMAPNKPVVIRGVTAGWRAAAEWRTADGRLQLGALGQLAGHCAVCVTDTSNQDDGCGVVRTMPLSEYMAWWTRRAASEQSTTQPQQPQPPLQPPQQPEPQQQPGCGNGGTAAPAGLTAAAAKPATDTTAAAACGGGPTAAAAPGRACCGGSGGSGGGSYEATNSTGGGGGEGGDGVCEGGGLMYLKDWHFVAEFPSYGAYRLPVYFADDWLNAYYDHLSEQRQRQGQPQPSQQQQQPQPDPVPSAPPPPPPPSSPSQQAADGGISGGGDLTAPTPPSAAAAAAFTSDYRFVYLGPAGTWTPLHSDVLRSHSWSANVAGRKRWLLLEPGASHLLYDKRMTVMAPHLELERAGRSGCDPRDFPGLDEARRRAYEFIQEAGDAVFVPSGWHHCVENLYDTLSINHNWINGHNCHWTWQLLRQQYMDAAEAIEDCRQLCPPVEFERLVQTNLAANMGLDWRGFLELLDCATRRALATLRAAGPNAAAGGGGGGGDEDGGGESRGGGRAWGLAEALDTGHEAMNALLELQRAGAVLKDFIATFEELVIAPAEKPSRRTWRGDDAQQDDPAWRLLQQDPVFINASALLERIGRELGSRGFIWPTHQPTQDFA